MKRKITAMLLILSMCMTLLPMAAVAAASATLSINKTNYSSGEGIFVTANVTDNNTNIVMCEANASVDDYFDNYYPDTGALSEEIFTAPQDDGQYEIRMIVLQTSGVPKLVASVPFSVGDAPAPTKPTTPATPSPAAKPATPTPTTPAKPTTPTPTAPTTPSNPNGKQTSANGLLSINKGNYAQREAIFVTATINGNNTVVNMCVIGSVLDDYIDNYNPSANVASEELFIAPEKDGNYEIRLVEWQESGVPKVIASVPFTVGKVATPTTPVPTQTGAFTLTAVPVSENNTVTGIKLNWTAVTGAQYYRVFRSETSGGYSYPLTDFDISGLSYVDVNIQSNKTYYYIVKPVMKTATATTDAVLGTASNEATVKIGATANVGGTAGTGGYILMKLNSPKMTVNGKEQEVDPGKGTAPISVNGRTMVPIRAVVEAMGGTVGWDDATKQITLKANGQTVVMTIGSTSYTVNGTQKIMDVAPEVKNGRTLLPLRFAGEALNCKINWINETQEILIAYQKNGTGKDVTATTSTATETPKPATTETPTVTAQAPVPTQSAVETGSIIGSWGLAASNISSVIEFKEDGTFVSAVVISYSTDIYRYAYTTRGNYEILDGSIVKCSSVVTTTRKIRKLTDIQESEIKTNIADYSFDYVVGKDAEGPYLQHNHNTNGTREPLTNTSVKWRISS